MGLEEAMIRLSFLMINACHFEPKARNLEFHFPQVLRGRGWGCGG